MNIVDTLLIIGLLVALGTSLAATGVFIWAYWVMISQTFRWITGRSSRERAGPPDIEAERDSGSRRGW